MQALVLFVLAGLAEIGGGWLVWQWLREHRPWLFGVLGGLVLILYGVIPTLQREPAFGRVYAAYGGVFVVLSLLWGWRVDAWVPGSLGPAWSSNLSLRRVHHYVRASDHVVSH